MARTLARILTLAALGLLAGSAGAAPRIAGLRGQARVLLLFAPMAGDPRLAMQDAALAADPAGLAGRDLRIVRVVAARVTGVADGATALRRRYRVTPGAFAVRLVGKDGHLALARADPLPLPDLFAAIDAMPMRRDEMRRR